MHLRQRQRMVAGRRRATCSSRLCSQSALLLLQAEHRRLQMVAAAAGTAPEFSNGRVLLLRVRCDALQPLSRMPARAALR